MLHVILLQPSDFWIGALHFGHCLVLSVRYVSDIKVSTIVVNCLFPCLIRYKCIKQGGQDLLDLNQTNRVYYPLLQNITHNIMPQVRVEYELEIVMNEMRKLKMSADFFANTSHDICRCPEV